MIPLEIMMESRFLEKKHLTIVFSWVQLPALTSRRTEREVSQGTIA
jgi:hypothetical protein